MAVQGCVTNLRWADEELVGDVRDRVSHETHLEFDNRGRLAVHWCSCDKASHCKHAVAILVAHAEKPPKPPPTKSESSAPLPKEAPKRIKAGDPVQLVQMWAEENGVADLLATSGRRIPMDREWAWLAWDIPQGSTALQLACKVVPMGARVARSAENLLAEQAVQWLQRSAEGRQAGRRYSELAESWRATPPEDPGLANLWRHLREERQRRGAFAASMIKAEGEPGKLSVQQDPPVLRWSCGGMRGCDGEKVELEVDLANPDRALPISCACGRVDVTPDTCGRAVEFLDLAIDRLTKGSGGKVRKDLAELIKTRPWERALAHLDRVLEHVGVADVAQLDSEGRELGWHVFRDRVGNWRVEPALMRPYKSAGKEGMRVWAVPLQTLRDRPHALPLDQDRLALARLTENGSTGTILRALIGHPRVVEDEGQPIQVHQGRFELGWAAGPEGGLNMVPAIDDAAIDAPTLLALLTDTQDRQHLLRTAPGRFSVIPLAPGAYELLLALVQRGLHYPGEAASAFMGRLDRLSRLVPIHLDARLRGKEEEPDERPVVRLEPRPEGALRLEVRVRPLPDGPVYLPGEGPIDVYAPRGTGRVFVRRYPEEEADMVEEALEGIAGLDLDPLWSQLLLDPEAALTMVSTLQEKVEEDVIQVEWTRDALKISHAASANGLRIQARTGRDWLTVGGEISVDDLQIPLSEILAVLRGGRRYVQVNALAWVRISETLASQLGPLASLSTDKAGEPTLSTIGAMLLDDLEEAGAEVEIPEVLQLQRGRVAEAAKMKIPLPRALKAKMRPYQRTGFEWMARLAHWAPGAVLADDMGLGKTLQALALLLRRAAGGPALVVAPTSVGFNWVDEARRFAPSLDVHLYRGKGREELLDDAKPGVVLVTSYDLAMRDRTALSEIHFHTLVLDEAQAIKNAGTARAQAVRALARDFTLALTGTPLENRTGELWSLFRAVVPGLLGSQEHFRARFAIPIERQNDLGRRGDLAAVVRPFLLRRTKALVAPELPARTEQTLTVRLSAPERRLYDAARMAALQTLGEDTADDRMKVLAALTRLRQIACHPRLVDPDSTLPSAKMEALVELVDEVVEGGHQMLIFSQFTRHLDLVAESLTPRGHRLLDLRGSTAAEVRQQRVGAFQRGDADVFLISLKAGGTGLNLTAASYVIHLDPWWNPAVEDQATDRAHRIGQDKPVTVYRLVAEDTIEPAILALHGEKRELVAGVLEGSAGAAPVDTATLMMLLRSHGGEGAAVV